MPVSQKFDNENNKLLITITGAFIFSENKGFRNAYKNITPDRKLDVSVDLKHIDYMDSAALGMLLLLDEHFKEQRINILNCSDYVKKILDTVNFSKKFNIS